MKRGLISWVLILALVASTFVGAMGVSLHNANAGAGNDLYADDLRNYFLDLVPSQSSDINAFFDLVDDALEVGSQKCVFAGEKNGYWIINIYNLPAGTDVYSFSDFYGNSGISKSPGWANVNFLREAYFAYNGTITYAPTSDQFYALMGEGFNYSNPAYWSYYFVPNIFDYQNANVYSSVDILPNAGFSFSANFFAGEPEPEYILFDVVVFYVGERKYFTFLQQDIFRDMMPDHMDYMVSFYADSSDEVISFTWDDVTLLPYAQNYINQPFENVSPAGIYAVDISIYDWVVLDLINLVGFDGDLHAYFAGYAVNSPYRLPGEPGSNGQPDSYTQSMNYFYEYTQNYNTTHFIPENLAETLFGLNGSKMYPCEVSVPVSISNEFNLTEATSFADVHTWQWWFSSREDLGMNFELMDVCIIPMSTTGNYSVVYYYSDSLSLQFEFVSNFSFDEICDNFDVVIILPDDEHVLSSANYWKLAYQTILAIFNRDPSYFDGSWLTYQGITGSSSLGVEYLDSRPNHGDYAGILEGFCIVTRKALQRQQLFVFNEGITKTYELMSNYLEERGKWEDSFLSWTMSLFYQWQTLDGKLGDIYNLLFELHFADWMTDITSKLQALVENTSPSEATPWYLPLWNFIQRFTPTVEQFADTITVIDTAYDDLPLLPEVTVPPAVPTVPLIGGG